MLNGTGRCEPLLTIGHILSIHFHKQGNEKICKLQLSWSEIFGKFARGPQSMLRKVHSKEQKPFNQTVNFYVAFVKKSIHSHPM